VLWDYGLQGDAESSAGAQPKALASAVYAYAANM
jgi:hemoglobin-like flavoprotein